MAKAEAAILLVTTLPGSVPRQSRELASWPRQRQLRPGHDGRHSSHRRREQNGERVSALKGFLFSILFGSSINGRGPELAEVHYGGFGRFLEWATDPEVTHFLTWEPYTSREQAMAYLTSEAIPNPWLKAVCLDGKAIGSINLRKGFGIHRCVAEIGYCLARKYWGRGYMTDAVKLAVSTGFQDLVVARIQALVQPENSRSQRVLEKAGFQREALLRNYVVLTINGEDRVWDCLVFSTCAPSL